MLGFWFKKRVVRDDLSSLTKQEWYFPTTGPDSKQTQFVESIVESVHKGQKSYIDLIGGQLLNLKENISNYKQEPKEDKEDVKKSLNRRTQTSQDIAQLLYTKRQFSKQTSFLHSIFNFKETYRNYRIEKVALQLRKTQHLKRIVRKNVNKQAWLKAISKYLDYAEKLCQEKGMLTENETVDSVSKAYEVLKKYQNQLSVSNESIQFDIVRGINNQIDRLMLDLTIKFHEKNTETEHYTPRLREF